MQYKAYKFRLYPNKTQKELLSKQFGCCRFVWNYFLHQRQEYYLQNKEDIEAKRIKGNLNYYDNANELVKMKKDENYIWLKETNSQSLLYVLQTLDTAYKDFFRKKTKFPQYKKKNNNQSFTVPQHIKVKENRVYFPKFNEGIRFKKHRNINGTIKHITISKNPSNQYFVSFCVEENIEPLEKTNNVIGIDVGIKDFAIMSNGEKIENKHFLKTKSKKLKFLQRQLRRQQKGSKNREKRRLKIAKLHNKINNQKTDFLHKITNKITNENQVIVIEDLKVANMMKNHHLAKSISEVNWYEFRKQLEYKCLWKGRQLVVVDRFFPSSKTCGNCGFINQELTLQDREWKCPNCHTILDRDLNAAKNILKQGLNICGWNDHIKLVEQSTLVDAMKQEAQASLVSE